MGSQSSYHAEEIGEAVPVHMVGNDDRSSVKQRFYTPQNEGVAADNESMFSESLVQLGRLDTIKARSTAAPEITLHTAVENVVPPRLRRRPVSEVFALPEAPKSAHRHRFSLNLNDGLDRLMENASTLKEENELRGIHSGNSTELHNRMNSAVSTDSFETAGDGNSATSLPEVPDHGVPLLGHRLPRRPSPSSMQKARHASQQYITHSRESFSDEALGTLHQAGSELGGSVIKSEMEGPEIASGSQRAVSGIVGSPILGSSIAGSPIAGAPVAGADANVSSIHQVPSHPQRDIQEKELSYDEACNTGFQPGTLLARSAPELAQARESIFTEMDQDDEYYDIDEPVVVAQPARAKSVKDSTVPSHKSTRRKRRSKKTDAGHQLKPFSYNTLIHLLESINGTVIGEEFDTLNLPVKEKQMIEKIVDSLSRLTLDMVIDQNRYEIGLERLEKAHRVLEGFL